MSSRSETNGYLNFSRPSLRDWLLYSILAACCVTGCRNARHDECRAFVYAVNSRLVEIDQLTAQSPSAQGVKPTDMRHLSELYAGLAEKIHNLAISSSELQRLRDQYRTMATDAASLARGIADSLEAKNIEAAMKAHERFSSVISREDELVSRVNAYCREQP